MKTIFTWLFTLSLTCSLMATEKTAVVTAPKSGTHLIKKLLHLIAEDQDILVIHSDSFLNEGNYKEEYPRRILLVRDPRDVCISWVNYVDMGLTKTPSAFPQIILDLPSEKKESWLKLSFDQKLMHTIRRSPNKAWKEAKLDSSLVNYPILPYEDALALAKDRKSKTLICKFENLVGPKGGGSAVAQMEEIQKIISFLNLEVSPEKLEDAISHLFGGTDTFHQGKIGKWKTKFTQKHKKVFKQKRSDLLIEFGYETDDKW